MSACAYPVWAACRTRATLAAALPLARRRVPLARRRAHHLRFHKSTVPAANHEWIYLR